MAYRITNRFSDQLEKVITLAEGRPFLFRYGLTVTTCLLASFLLFGTHAIIGPTNPYLFLLGAVLVSSWYGGSRPGYLAFLYSVVFSWLTYVQPAIDARDPALIRVLLQDGLFIVESILVLLLAYRRHKNYIEMQVRTAQQAVIATIGQYGLEEQNLTGFIQRVMHAISKTLDVEYCQVLELLPDNKSLRFRSGIGWRRGLLGKIIYTGDSNSQASYTLQVNRPVIFRNLQKERRFSGTELLEEQEIVSGMSVVIPGSPQPYGVLAVHTKKQREFTRDDVNFLTALANVISTTIERRTIRYELELMSRLNSELVNSLDLDQTLAGVVSSLVPNFAETCEIYIKDAEQRTSLFEVKSTVKEKERLFREIGDKYPPLFSSKRPTARVLRSGKPLYMPLLSLSYLDDVSTDAYHKKLIRQLGLTSIMVLPIKARHKIIGTIGFGSFDRGRIFNERNFLLAQEIADRVAVAIDNANLYQEARNAVQARDEFLSIASHELKTPLTSMLLQLQAVLHSIKNESLASFSIEKTMIMLESTLSQSKRLTRLVNDLLNISLITTGRLQLEKEKVDLTRTVKDVMQKLSPQIKKDKITISFNGPESLIGNWDPIRLEQVLINLLTNAIKYGEGKPVEVELQEKNNIALLRIIDHGMGIPQDQQGKIFKRFQRGKVKASIKGLGVGLYLVNEIVLAHKGKIELESTLKQGSTFSIELPLST
ncbi:MAG: ATP-binding protein [Patescibacteria group bacterium]